MNWYTQGVPGVKVSILGGHSIGHFKQENIYCDVDSATLGKHPPPPAVFLHTEPKHAGCYEAVNSSWQRCLTTPVNTTSGNKAARETTVARQSVNTVTTQQGNEGRVFHCPTEGL
jgi:hypothetical protein